MAATLILSARDAATRADSSDSGRCNETAQAGRADRDEVLARAVARVALERDWSDVGSAFLETRESLREPMQELWQAHRATSTRQDQFRLDGAQQPQAAGAWGMFEHDIEALATGESAA
jgi:hypothetical protein